MLDLHLRAVVRVGSPVVAAAVFFLLTFSNSFFPSNAQKFSLMSGTISGRVFHDFNSNGAYDTAGGLSSVDAGVAGVTVTAYDSLGVSRGSTTSGANGTYSLAATGTGPYRVEFTTLPAGYFPSARSANSVFGGTATDSGSSVQFVGDGGTVDANLALSRPEEFCENNPELVVSRFAFGAQNGVYGANAALRDFPYDAGTDYTDPTVSNYDSPAAASLTTSISSVGTVLSLAYNRTNNRVYAASYFKRHAGLGPGADGTYGNNDDPGAVYLVDPSTSAVTATFTVPNAESNLHDPTNYGNDNMSAGWDAVGKTSLGGMDLSDDGATLYVMNLENRRLYALDAATGVVLGNSVRINTLTLPTPGGSNTNCPNGSGGTNKRPFAVNYYRGQVYLGVLCTAQTTQDAADLFAYVFQVDPATLAITPTPIFTAPLNYDRGLADPGWAAEWQPWRTTITDDFAAPQPLFTSLVFENDNLVLGLRDRAGDQALDNGPNRKRTAGDTLKACGSFGSWTLESNGRCGGDGAAPQATGQGAGDGEFFHQDDFCTSPNNGNYHDEVSWGAMLYIPGRQHVVTTVLDPISRVVATNATFDGGFRYFNNTTGSTERAYRVYNGNGGPNVPDFGKANGLGGVTAMCGRAPIEIGNRVWLDLNGNGVQEPNESRSGAPPVLMSGVTVRLYDAGGNLIASALTDQDGEYYFSSAPGTSTGNAIYNLALAPNTTYQVRFDNPADYAPGGPLAGLSLTLADRTFQPGDDDASDSDASDVVDPPGSPAGTFPVITLTTGPEGANNHTFDVGFRAGPTAADAFVAGRVTTSSGRGIRNVRLSLTLADGTVMSAITSTFGHYRFDGIPAGQAAVLRISSKRFHFPNPVVFMNVSDNVTGVDFVAN
ncbi:MAG: SdrD B-like domain-containing protein [Pyrinomonadaceae bacterium]